MSNRASRLLAVPAACLVVLLCLVALYIAEQRHREREKEEAKPYLTYCCLMNLAEGCDRYKTETGTWPSTLAQLLAVRPELVSPWSTDAWGRVAIFTPYKESSGFGEIISYGRDGKVGGTGLDRDIEVRFPAEWNTNWNGRVGASLQEPRLGLY